MKSEIIDLEPGFRTDAFRQFLLSHGASRELIGTIVRNIDAVNEKIASDTTNLGKGYSVGHSFFCALPDNGKLDDAWYRHVVRTEIAPLLREYWFDDPTRAESLVSDILLAD